MMELRKTESLVHQLFRIPYLFDAIFRKHLKDHKETHQKLAEYELNKSTGEVQKVCECGVKGCD